MQDLSRIGGAFGEEMHFFGGAGRVCPGMGPVSGRMSLSGGVCPRMGSVLGRKCISLVELGGFVPDWGWFRGGSAFLWWSWEGLSRIWVGFGEEMHFFGDLSRNGAGFGEEMHFLGGSCSGPGHRAAGAAFRLSCGGCSERLAGAFASRVALQHFFQINITT